jgi:hypothetical protein
VKASTTRRRKTEISHIKYLALEEPKTRFPKFSLTAKEGKIIKKLPKIWCKDETEEDKNKKFFYRQT